MGTTSRYLVTYKTNLGTFLLMRDTRTPFIDEHEACTLSVIQSLYSQICAKPMGVMAMKQDELEFRILKHKFERDEDDDVNAESIVSWLKEVQNADAIPTEIRGLLDLEIGTMMQIYMTPAGTFAGIPLREELIAFDYCCDDKTERLRADAISTVSN